MGDGEQLLMGVEVGAQRRRSGSSPGDPPVGAQLGKDWNYGSILLKGQKEVGV